MLRHLLPAVLLALPAAAAPPEIDFISLHSAAEYASDASVGPIASVNNAALLYNRYAQLLDRDLCADVKAYADEHGGWEDASWAPEGELAERLAASGAIRGYLRAATIEHADFGVELELGIWATLPHLAPMRDAACVLAADARRLRAAGKPDAAAMRLAALVRMSRHACEDPVLIGSLVGVAIGNLACSEMQHFARSGEMTAGARQTLSGALSELEVDDPFRLREAVGNERDIFLPWFSAVLRDSDQAQVREIMTLFGEEPEPELLALDADGLIAAADRARGYYDLVAKVWDQPDATARLKEIEQLLESGGFGPVAKAIGASASRVHESSDRVEQRIADTRRALREAVIVRPKHALPEGEAETKRMP